MGNHYSAIPSNRSENGKRRSNTVTVKVEKMEDQQQTKARRNTVEVAPAKKSAKYEREEGTLFEDFEQVLPDEILTSIFLRSNTYAISVVVPIVCRQFYNNTVPDSYLWKQKCKLKNRRLLNQSHSQIRTFKYTYITQKLFDVQGRTQNSQNTARAELTHLLLKCNDHNITGEGKYVKNGREAHASWKGIISEEGQVFIEEEYDHERDPYHYEGILDFETGVIKGRYYRDDIKGIFEFKLSPKIALKKPK